MLQPYIKPAGGAAEQCSITMLEYMSESVGLSSVYFVQVQALFLNVAFTVLTARGAYVALWKDDMHKL